MVAQRAFGVKSPSRVGLGLIVVAAVACSSTPPEGTGRNAQALNGSLGISGEINDATGLPLGGAVVQLLRHSDDGDDGDTDDAPLSVVRTAADGTFSLFGLSPGSYRVMPKRKHCRFDPRDVALTLVGNAAVDFQGAGSGCGGTPTVNFGAMQGPLTLSGRVLDGAGNGVVGARIELTGHGYGQEHPAVRYSDLMGGYTFHVEPGSYEPTESADCVLNPSEIKLHHLAVDRTQDFEAVSSGCMSASVTNRNPTGTAFAISQAGQALGMVFVDLEQRASLAAAMTRLQQIISEQPNPVRSLTIAGYPAIERQMPNPVDPEPVISGVSDGGGPSTQTTSLTGAIAAGSTIVRFESQLIATVSPTTVGAIFQVTARPSAVTALRVAATAIAMALLDFAPSRATMRAAGRQGVMTRRDEAKAARAAAPADGATSPADEAACPANGAAGPSVDAVGPAVGAAGAANDAISLANRADEKSVGHVCLVERQTGAEEPAAPMNVVAIASASSAPRPSALAGAPSVDADAPSAPPDSPSAPARRPSAPPDHVARVTSKAIQTLIASRLARAGLDESDAKDMKFKTWCQGEAYLVRFADDFVACFQYKRDAERLDRILKQRMKKFSLELAPEKTRMLLFGRFARERTAEYGKKPESFECVGFKHVCGTDVNGKTATVRIPSPKSCRKFLDRTHEWLERHLHWKRRDQQRHLASMLRASPEPSRVPVPPTQNELE